MRQHSKWLVGLSALVLASCGTVPPATPQSAAEGQSAVADVGGMDLSAQALKAWPVLQQGASGQAVTTAQYLLRAAGRSLTVDGSFGPGTASAVRSFQQSRGLGVDGVIGPSTWSALIVVLRQGDQGNAVRALQSELRISVDGSFGSGTASAVRSFQQSNGLSVDGVVGPATWQALVAGTSGSTPPSGDRASLARQILNSSRISLYNQMPLNTGSTDGADALSNIRDTAGGGTSKVSSYGNAPGGRVYLDTRMLRGMLSTANTYTYRVTSITGGSHSVGSKHYKGLAFDLDLINGRKVNSSNPYYRGFMSACRSAGATTVLGPGDAGHSTHLHCSW